MGRRRKGKRNPEGSADGRLFSVPDRLGMCSSSDDVRFSLSLRSIDDWRFFTCRTVPYPIRAFQSISFPSLHIHIPDFVRELPSECFKGVSVLAITFGPSSLLESIGASAFKRTRITEINMPNGVRHLGPKCFVGSPLKRVMFGAGTLDHIGPKVFY